MQATEKLAKDVAESDITFLNDDVINVAKKIILDGIAVAIAGALERAPLLAAQHILSMGGNPISSVLGFGFKTSPTQAAYINGISMHVLDFEAMWHPPTHATSPTLPVTLAVAEWLGLSGSDIILALVLGFEIQGKIRRATSYLNPDDLKFHPPGAVGVIGAAATAAKMLKLDVKRTRYAFGIAASNAGSLIANIGTMTKANHCGNAARLGLEAALLAQNSFTSNQNVIEAHGGYAEAIYNGEFDFEVLTETLGQPFSMLEPGMAFKLFPCQYGTHFGINAALELRKNVDFKLDEIKQVQIISPLMRYVDRPKPCNGLDGKFSFQYTVAAALLDGNIDIDTFTDSRRFKSDMVNMLEKISLVQRKDISKSFYDMYVTVRIYLRNGKVIEHICYKPKGAWGQQVSFDELSIKAKMCLNRGLHINKVEECIDLINSFELLNSDEIRYLITLLSLSEKLSTEENIYEP